MASILESLLAGLDPDIRDSVRARYHDLVRELRYLAEKDDSRLVRILRGGWSMEKLEVICGLNSFYQRFIGPLSSVTGASPESGLGRRIPINHGKLRVDQGFIRQVKAATTSFLNIASSFQIEKSWLEAPHASDLVFRMSITEDE